MVVGLNNIITTLYLLIAFIATSSVMRLHFVNAFPRYVFLIMSCATFLTLGLLFILKFRILYVTNDKIVSLHPFRLRLTVINKRKIKTIYLRTWEIQRSPRFITMVIKDIDNREIAISDFEFENFESLVLAINGKEYMDTLIPYYQTQAKMNLGSHYIIFCGILFLVVFSIWNFDLNNFDTINSSIIYALLILLLVYTKRIVKLRKYGI